MVYAIIIIIVVLILAFVCCAECCDECCTDDPIQLNQKPSPLYITKYKCKMNIPIIGYVTDFPLCHRFPVSGVNDRVRVPLSIGYRMG